MINSTSVFNRYVLTLFLAFTCLLALSVGCSVDDPNGRLPLSGTVTVDDEPIKDGYIMFVSTSGGKSSGGKVVEGSFDLSDNKGVPQGSYKVKITANRPSGKKIPDSDYPDQMIDDVEQYIPKRYNEETELNVEVDGPLEDLVYKLKSK